MNERIIELIIAVFGFIMAAMFYGNIYYIKSLIANIKSLTESVNEHKLSIETEKVKTNHFRTSCTDTHETVNNRLNAHSSKLADHDHRLTILDERIKK